MTKLRIALSGFLGLVIAAWAGQAAAGANYILDYYEDNIDGQTFSPVPNGYFLLIKHLYCYLSPSSGGFTDAYLTIVNNPSRAVHLPVVAGEGGKYTITGETDFLVNTGRMPGVGLIGSYSGSPNAHCTIIGKLIPGGSKGPILD